MNIEMTPCKSSNVSAYGYDKDTGTMAVQFKSGGIYHYAGVPEKVADQMQKAESIGQFVGQLKKNFTATNMTPVKEDK